MAITHFKGDRSPSLSDTIRVDGVAFDLTTSTVKFRMRAEGSSTLAIDEAAVVVSAVAGTVRYDPSATFAALAAGDYLGWWQVTLPSAKTQDTPEFELVIVEHVPVSPDVYVRTEEFKDTLSLTGEKFADEDVKIALRASSRAIDEMCARRFYPDADANQVRYYSPSRSDYIQVDDIITITSLKTDPGGDGTFEQTWTLNTDYTREPLNAGGDGKPWTILRAHPSSSFYFPFGYPRSVELTGKFGWASVPPAIEHATTLLAHRLLKRAREVPFGIAGIGLDGSAVRIVAQDPDVLALVQPFSRAVLVA